MKVFLILLALYLGASRVQSDDGDDNLPMLRQQFQTYIQGSVVHKNYSVSQTVYFDNDNNRGAVYTWFPGDHLTIQLYDFEYYEVYDLTVRNKTCTTSDLKTDREIWLQYTDTESGGHIIDASAWLEFGKAFNVTLESKESDHVSGILVDKWVSNMTFKDVVYNVTHYFNSVTYKMPAIQLGQQVPVRVEVTGEDFYNIYDYVTFLPGPIEDPSVFEIPRGFHCDRNRTQKELKFQDNFSVKMQASDPDNKTLDTFKLVYNFAHNLSKSEFVASSRRPEYKMYEGKEIHVIHDFSSGIEYVLSDLSADKIKCKLSPLISPSSNDSFDAKNVDGHYVMRHGRELFHNDELNYTWQGVRQMRGVMCDVWSAHVTLNDTTRVVERYTTQSNWRVGTSDGSENPVAIAYWWGVLETNETGEVDITEQSEGHLFDHSIEVSVNDFDVRPCYDSPEQMIHCMFTMTGSYSDIVKNREHSLGPAVRDAVSKATAIEPIRVTDIYFDPNSKNGVNVWITLLDKPGITGSFRNPYPQIDKEKAFDILKSKIQSGQFTVTGNSVEKDSLKTDEEVLDPRQPTPPAEQSTGYSGGAMAGLAVGMLLCGILVAVLGLYFYEQRCGRRGIPYERNQDI